jgi:hypothetical protein
MKLVKFIRSVAVDQIHRETGSEMEVSDETASILIADGAAIEIEVRETATAKKK